MGTKAKPFWEQVIKSDGCWTWTGYHDRLGYSKVWARGRIRYVHRETYELVVGPIPADRELDHLCRNPGCINPAHLDPVTHRENIRRSPLVRNRGPLCKRGHVLDYTGPSGRRGCRQCRYASVKRWRGRVKDFAERHGTPREGEK